MSELQIRNGERTGTGTSALVNGGRVNGLRGDLLASMVVFLIAVPLSLGIAQASGAPPIAGIIAAVVGGIVVGLLGGAPLQVSGPAAGLTVLVFGYVQQFGWRVACAITVGAGVVQLGLGAAKIARTALAISPAVVHGMLAGIGVTIALAQLHVVLGGASQASPVKNILALPQQIVDHHGPAVFLGVFTLALLILWEYVPKKIKAVPGALVAVTAATFLSIALRLPVQRVNLPENLLASFALPSLPQDANLSGVLIAIGSVALVASVESLLSAVATDKLHNGPRANLDRELIGQGAGNVVSGMLGGLPLTGVIVRSSANINTGATTKLSAILHGIWIALFVSLLSGMIRQIPTSVLAGLLVFVGIRLVNKNHIRELAHHREIPIYAITLAGVVGLNLLAGVGMGIALAVFLLLRRIAHTRITVESRGEEKWHVHIDGSLTFISVPQLTGALAQIPAGAQVDVDLMTDFLDHAAFEALHNWRAGHERMGGRVDIDEVHEAWYESAASGAPRKRKTFFGRQDTVRKTLTDTGAKGATAEAAHI